LPFAFLVTNFSTMTTLSLIIFAVSGVLTPGIVRLL
jgi:hypothetical protein